MTLERRGRGPLAMFLHSRSARRIAAAVEAVERLPPDLGRPQRRRLHVPVIRSDLVADAASYTLGFVNVAASIVELGPVFHSYSGQLTPSVITPGRIHVGRAGAYVLAFHVIYHTEPGNELGVVIQDRGVSLGLPTADTSSVLGGGADVPGLHRVRLTVSQHMVSPLEVDTELALVAARTAGTGTIFLEYGRFTVYRIGDFVSSS